MKKRRHIESDGNGGFYVTKKAIVFISSMIAITMFFVGLFSSVLAVTTDYTIMKEDVSDIKESNSLVRPVVLQNKQDIAVMKETLHRIDINIQKLVYEGG